MNGYMYVSKLIEDITSVNSMNEKRYTEWNMRQDGALIIYKNMSAAETAPFWC